MMLSFKIVCGAVIVIVGSLTSYGQPVSENSARRRVEIDKANQVLRAYEGNLLVFQTNISTGRAGKETPNGSYHAEGKDLMHYSRLYDNAPMPYSVQVASNYFIHGFSYVPSYPASHGCIRLPINAARQFYGWIHVGTPIEIYGHWRGGSVASSNSNRAIMARADRSHGAFRTQYVAPQAIAEQIYRRARSERIYPPD